MPSQRAQFVFCAGQKQCRSEAVHLRLPRGGATRRPLQQASQHARFDSSLEALFIAWSTLRDMLWNRLVTAMYAPNMATAMMNHAKLPNT